LDKGIIRTQMVSARDIVLALLSEVPLSSGILPRDALWWKQGKEGPEVALWRSPRVWAAALQLEAFKPPQRFKLPMPVLIFPGYHQVLLTVAAGHEYRQRQVIEVPGYLSMHQLYSFF
ncbi:unnamed protein product, partial [marine sediment metagenome]